MLTSLSPPRTGHSIRNCDYCKTPYEADNRNLKRGWGLTCSKSCAASMRERSKPGYDPKRVARNNFLRSVQVLGGVDENGYGEFRGSYTSEGYKMYEHGNEYTAVDEFGDAVYSGNLGEDDPGDSEYWDSKDY